MKRSKKFSKVILLTTLTALTLSGLTSCTHTRTNCAAQSTSSTDTETVSKIDVSTTVELTGGKTLKNDNETAIDAVENKVTFNNGGTAIINKDNNVELTNISSGDSVTVKVTTTNNSTVNIKYRVVVETSDDLNNVISMDGKVDNEEMKVCKNGLFTNYKEKVAQGNLGVYTLDIGIDKNTAIEASKSGTIKITLEAVKTDVAVTDLSEYKNASTKNDFVNAITALNNGNVNSDSVIEVSNNIDLDDTIEIKKDITLILDGDITALSNSSAIKVTSGATLTIGEQLVNTSKSTLVKSSRVFKKVASNTGTIKVSSTENAAVEVDGSSSTVIFNEGKIDSKGYGFKAINGGEIIVNDCDVSSTKSAVFASSNSKITINGGSLTTIDAAIFETDENTGCGGNTLIINDGTFNGSITTSGFVSCGVYVANDDTFLVNGGTFNIDNGCGVLARSGDVTISDDVIFNFSNSKTLLTEGNVGSVNCNIPVNARVVKDLSSLSNKPVVKAASAIEIKETTGKAYLVSSESELNNALDDLEYSSKYIVIKDSFEITSPTTVSTKYTSIYGDGNVSITANVTNTSTSSRVFNIFGDDESTESGYLESLIGGSFTLLDVKISAYPDSEHKNSHDNTNNRGINIYCTKDYSVTLNNVGIKVGHYGIYDYLNSGLTIDIKNTTIDAYGCYYSFVDGNMLSLDTSATFENCVFNGNNTYPTNSSNPFSNIYLGSAKSLDSITEEIASNSFTFNKCTFNMNSTLGNKQRIIEIDYLGKTVTMDDCSFYSKTGENLDTVVEITDNYSDYMTGLSLATVTIDGTTYYC